MLFSVNEIQKYTLRAVDGDLGKIHSFLIDDYDWKVRYLVVETGRRSVLLSVRAVGAPDSVLQVLPVNLNPERIENSPIIDLDKPLSREIERQLSDYYEWPYYWEPDDVPNTRPGDLTAVPLIEMELEREEKEQELIPETGAGSANPIHQNHLRSTKEVFGYSIHTTNDDQNAGKLDDLIVQAEDWNIQYLVVSSNGLISSNKVLLTPSWVQQVVETKSRIDVNLSEKTIRESPPFNSIEDLSGEYQDRHRNYYNS